MSENASGSDGADQGDWEVRQKYWRKKLGRLRLGAEPLQSQLAKYRRVTWALTLVPLVLAVIFLSLFAAFDRPDVGFALVLVLLAPIVGLAWLDDAVRSSRVSRYQQELAEYERRRATAGRT